MAPGDESDRYCRQKSRFVLARIGAMLAQRVTKSSTRAISALMAA